MEIYIKNKIYLVPREGIVAKYIILFITNGTIYNETQVFYYLRASFQDQKYYYRGKMEGYRSLRAFLVSEWSCSLYIMNLQWCVFFFTALVVFLFWLEKCLKILNNIIIYIYWKWDTHGKRSYSCNVSYRAGLWIKMFQFGIRYFHIVHVEYFFNR